MNDSRRIAALRMYREMPDEGLVPVAAVMALTGWGRTTTWRRVKEGAFPPPIRLGRAIRWRKRDIGAFLRCAAHQEGAAHGL